MQIPCFWVQRSTFDSKSTGRQIQNLTCNREANPLWIGHSDHKRQQLTKGSKCGATTASASARSWRLGTEPPSMGPTGPGLSERGRSCKRPLPTTEGALYVANRTGYTSCVIPSRKASALKVSTVFRFKRCGKHKDMAHQCSRCWATPSLLDGSPPMAQHQSCQGDSSRKPRHTGSDVSPIYIYYKWYEYMWQSSRNGIEVRWSVQKWTIIWNISQIGHPQLVQTMCRGRFTASRCQPLIFEPHGKRAPLATAPSGGERCGVNI